MTRLSKTAVWCAALLLSLLSAQTVARAPAVPVEEMLPVELATVGFESGSGSPVVVLREPASGDVVLISIGSGEALAILLALRDVPTPRPMTHDLLASVIGSLDAEVERVLVDALVGATYTGVIELGVPGREGPVRVDSRPSDALALAVRTGAEILVSPDVLMATRGLEFEGLPESQQVVSALGITVGEVTPDLREALGLPDDPGLVVSRTVGEAEELGLEPGALILEVNGRVPRSPMQFLDLVRGTEPGKRARVRIWQDGETRELQLSTDVPERPTPERNPADGDALEV
ncbi:bifunctional nuclease domain-containing protein [Thioalkalivibrio sp.]|uniref:bifunctional nuclease domain-containing protein n=1 Tax=Thioalkalivibrio sp. TaxID=2093813 RepID=UPI0035697C15